MIFLINILFYLSYLTHKKSINNALFYASIVLSYMLMLVSLAIEASLGIPVFSLLFSVNQVLAVVVPMCLSAALIYYLSVSSKQYLILERYFRLMKSEVRKKKLLKYKVCVVFTMMLTSVISILRTELSESPERSHAERKGVRSCILQVGSG